MEYVSGPFAALPDFASLYTFVSSNPGNYMEGNANSADWLGTHTMRLKCVLGTLDPGSPRGNQGLFNEVYSAPIVVVIANPYPCHDPAHSGIALPFEVDDMEVPPGTLTLQRDFNGP